MDARITAAKKRRHGVVNSVNKLKTREISAKSRRRLNFDGECFRNFKLHEEYDIYDHDEDEEDYPSTLLFLKPKSKIIDLFAIGDVVFALAKAGIGAAFSRVTKKRMCLLNTSPDEVIRSLFYNQENDSLITVSVCGSRALTCRSTSIEYIRRGEPDAGFRLFESESIKFVEFDDLNGRIIVQCEGDKIYKVFDLRNYTFLYSIIDKDIRKIEINQGILIVIYKSTRRSVPLKLVSAQDGTVVKSFNHLLDKKKRVVFVAYYKEKLIAKQDYENIQIVDVANSQITQVSGTEFLTPTAIIFFGNQLLVTLRNHTAMLWNLRGELVTSFKDHRLWHLDYKTCNICVPRNRNFIISYGKIDSSGNPYGSINICSVLTGKCVGKITRSNSVKGIKIRSTVAEALKDIKALFYDEEHNEIYTGNKFGRIHVWTN